MRANGRARVSTRNPQAFGICDGCGLRYNRVDLSWQYEWAGMELQNQRYLVCDRCLDEPNPQLRTYIPPADPLPVRDPRPDASAMGITTLVTTVAATSATLVPAAAAAQYIAFQAPIAAGLWLNMSGGTAGPGLLNCLFYAPTYPFVANNFPAGVAVTYWCAIGGLTIPVLTGAAGAAGGLFLLDVPGRDVLDGILILG